VLSRIKTIAFVKRSLGLDLRTAKDIVDMLVQESDPNSLGRALRLAIVAQTEKKLKELRYQ
jgi:hypothetical protein